MKKNKSPKSSNSFDRTRLAIIGMACLFPKADSLEVYWANILQGVDAIEGYECVIDTSLNCAFRRNQLPRQNRIKDMAGNVC